MYFASRMQAGRMLAAQIVPKYRDQKCAVIGIGDGGVMIGAQIASQLRCVLTMLLVEEVSLPREPVAIGGMLEDGTFSYNQAMSSGELEEMTTEYRGTIEQEKLAKFHKLNGLVGSGGLIDKKLLRGRNIILASDGFKDNFSLDMALVFLKPVEVKKLIIATPLASVRAIDRMHITVDEINCMNVVENYMDTDHYYDTNDVPEHMKVIETIEQIVANWK